MKNIKKFIYSPVFVIIIVFIMLISGIKFWQNYRKINQLKEKIDILNQRIQKAENENQQIKEELNNLKDYSYVEKIARKELGLVKPGEILLIPIEENKSK